MLMELHVHGACIIFIQCLLILDFIFMLVMTPEAHNLDFFHLKAHNLDFMLLITPNNFPWETRLLP